MPHYYSSSSSSVSAANFNLLAGQQCAVNHVRDHGCVPGRLVSLSRLAHAGPLRTLEQQESALGHTEGGETGQAFAALPSRFDLLSALCVGDDAA